MEKVEIRYHSIGTIHSPHKDLSGMPIQPAAGAGIRGTVRIDPELQEGLKDLDGFSHLVLVYHFHRAKESNLLTIPFLDDVLRGVFATRAPRRPNGIGISVVKLLAIEENLLTIENVDILDGTPLLDIKPFVPDFDGEDQVQIGWLEKMSGKIQGKLSDDRFK